MPVSKRTKTASERTRSAVKRRATQKKPAKRRASKHKGDALAATEHRQGGWNIWKIEVTSHNEKKPYRALAIRAGSKHDAMLRANALFPEFEIKCKGLVEGIDAESVDWMSRNFKYVEEEIRAASPA